MDVKKANALLDIESWDMQVRQCEERSKLIQVAEDVAYIVGHSPDFDNVELRHRLFFEVLSKKVYRLGHWREEQDTSWKSYYSNMPKEYDGFQEMACYERFASPKYNYPIDPIEYLLFIQSLFGSFENFMKNYSY